MGILIGNNGDKVVANISARDTLFRKFNGMEVTVLDAIADVAVGPGAAGYKWLAGQSRWQLIWKTTKDNLIFITESKVISGGVALATYAPQDGIVWDCKIIDPTGLIVADVTPTVIDANVNIGSLNFDGTLLAMTYAYGAITAQIAQSAARNRFLTASFTGPLEPAIAKGRWYPPVPVMLTSVYLSVGVAPTGVPVVVDVLKNGISIFVEDLPFMPVGSYRGAVIPVSTSLTIDDYLTISITEADSGEDLTAFVSYTTVG